MKLWNGLGLAVGFVAGLLFEIIAMPFVLAFGLITFVGVRLMGLFRKGGRDE